MTFKLLKYISGAFLILIIFFQTTYAIGWGEEVIIFQNKTSGEYKKTYKRLYRSDFEKFRDGLNDYVRNIDLPNSEVLNDWVVIYYKYCDREDCKEKGKIKDGLDYEKMGNITKNDLSKDDYSKLTFQLSPLTKFLINMGIMTITFFGIFIYITIWIVRGIKFLIKKYKYNKI